MSKKGQNSKIIGVISEKIRRNFGLNKNEEKLTILKGLITIFRLLEPSIPPRACSQAIKRACLSF